MPHQIAITGHRKLLNEKEVRNNVALSLQYFKDKYIDIIAISALAEGADTIFIQEAIKQQIPVRFILPFALAEYKKDFSAEALMVLEDLIKNNNNQYEVVKTLKNNSNEERNEAYLAVGKELVDKYDIVIAVWDGQPAAGKGGTGEVVEYAKSKEKEVHIIEGLRLKSVKQKEDILFDKLDKTAVRYKEWIFQPAWYFGLFLAILGVVFFAISLAFQNEFNTTELKLSITLFEVISILLSAILILVVARKYKNSFLDNRRNAEYLRTLLRFKQINVALPRVSIDEIFVTKKAKHPIEIKPEIIDFENVLIINKKEEVVFEDAKRKFWIFAQDQINYHEKTRLKPLKAKETTIHVILDVLKWIFYLSITLKVVIEVQHFFVENEINLPHFLIDFLLPWLNLLLIVTPSVFAVIETVKSFEEWERNKDESEKMISKLSEVKKEIFEADSEVKLKKASKNLRLELEIENSEWADRVASLTPGVHI